MNPSTATLLLGSMPMASPAVAAPAMPAWAVLAMAAFGAISLTVVMIVAARQEKARRIAAFEAWVRSAMPHEDADELAALPTLPLPRHGRGRPATLRRRRGGEWDTPVVPTVTARPDRPERHRTRRI